MPSVEEEGVWGETVEKPCRGTFVVPAVKRMPKAQAATAGTMKNHAIQ